MKKVLRIAAIVLIAALALAGWNVWQLWGPANPPPGQPALVALTQDNLAELRAEFNAAADRTRVVTLLAPT